jgi:TetR/AcrR family transcriptional regulator
MNDNFDKLSMEKKKTIIDASIDEFSRNGYDKASTNNIVKQAGISKGILFHYFGSKKNLYLYLLDFCTDYYVSYLKENTNEDSNDFFERVLYWTKLKLNMSAKEPALYHFFTNVYLDIPEDFKCEIDEKYRELLEINNSILLNNVDMTKFKEDINKEKAIELIFMTFNGLVDKYVEIYKTCDHKENGICEEVYEELEQYVVIMKSAFYR